MEKADYDALARVRMEGAQMCLKEAEHLLADELYKGANNRAFYAMEKAVKALLATKGIEIKTHNGSMKQFNLHFIHNESEYFSEKDYQVISGAEQIRNASDYNDFYIARKEDAVQQVKNARYLVEKIDRYLRRNEKQF